MFSMERSSSLYISLVQIMKRIQLPIPCFYERAFADFPCLKLHDFSPFKTEFFFGGGGGGVGGKPPSPPTHEQYQNYHVICVLV